MKTLKILCILTLLLAFTAFAFKSDIFEEYEKPGCTGIAGEAPSFQLPDGTGKKVGFADFPNAKGFILIFTSKKCAFSRIYEQRIANLNQKYAPKGFPVIALDPLQEPSALRKREKKDYPLLADLNGRIFRRYGGERIPQTFVLFRKNGEINVEYKGAIDSHYRHSSTAKKQYVGDAVNALLKGEEIEIKTTRSAGCPVSSS